MAAAQAVSGLHLGATYALLHTGDLASDKLGTLDGRPGKLVASSGGYAVVNLDDPTDTQPLVWVVGNCTGVCYLSGYKYAACCGGTASVVEVDEDGVFVGSSALGMGVCVDVACDAGVVAVQGPGGVMQVYTAADGVLQITRTFDPAPETIAAYNGVLYYGQTGASQVSKCLFATLTDATEPEETLDYPFAHLSVFWPPGSTRNYLCATTTNARASQASVACYLH